MRHSALLASTRELPLQDGRPNLLSLLFTRQLLASVLKNPPEQQKCTIYAIYEKQNRKKKRCGGGRGVKKFTFFQHNLEPVCTGVIAFTVLFAVIQRKETTTKKFREKPKPAYLKKKKKGKINHHNDPIY